ncbi:MAG: hypothetical protein H8E98_02840, partial [Bacteroidetes bacterium]|nr:hypothetical protein [Bacteroidota bacterium]
MRIELAEKLLIKIMQWTPEEVQQERPLLQSIANFKYDEYQQFSTGMRFIESMVKWLKQFETIEQKKISYQFIKNHLVFISGEQIAHLVALAYTEKVQPMLIEKAAIELNLNKYSIRTIVNSDIYKCYKRQTLFIGLSDGSEIDYFRRVSKINNEQVYSVYDISEQKVDDMVLKLNHDQPSVNKFNMVYLIDDFTASGRSYCRDENGGKTGKIIKFLNKVYQISNSNAKHYQKLIDV